MATGIAVFGGGCFWCTEAIFQRLRGVVAVTSGYAGGHTANPTYEEVASRQTGHAEVIRVEFHPHEVSYSVLLDIFFSFHDPTTVDRQGNDVGPEYRSVIFTTDDTQIAEAEAYIRKLEADKVFSAPIVTTVEPLTNFYPAEPNHQNFYNNNERSSYCQIIISPKIAKLRKSFSNLLHDPDA